MKIKALGLIVEWDEGQMVVINPGETGELSDAKAREKTDAGLARPVGKLPQLDHDHDGKAGGSKPRAAKTSAPSALGEARKAYKAAFGKAPGPRWPVAEIEAKIAAKQAGATAEGETGSESAADSPPAA